MKCLADRGNRVLYVDYAYTWKDWFSGLFGRGFAPWRRMVGLQNRIREVPTGKGGHLWVLSLPPVIPANFIQSPWLYDLVTRINGVGMRRAIRKATQKLQFSDPVVINAFNPVYGLQLAGRLNEKKLIYYCYDEISAAAWAGKHGARLESQFMDMADATVVSSEGLAIGKTAPGRSVFTIKNGVDFEQFAHSQNSLDIPFSRKGRQVAGYLGSIDDRLDFDLLEAAFAALPDVLFVLVGRIQTEAIRARLAGFNNVYLAGPQPPETLPAWVHQMQVGLIPFVKNAFTAGIYPLKINEYLACGKQVVSTRFAPLQEFESVVHWAEQPETFVQAIKTALDASYNTAGQHFAKSNDWASRAAEFEKILSGGSNY